MKNNPFLPEIHNKYVSPLPKPIYYAIRIKSLLDPHWDWLGNLSVIHLEQGETLLYGPILDQAELHGLLARIRDLNLTLLDVNQINSNNYKKEE